MEKKYKRRAKRKWDRHCIGEETDAGVGHYIYIHIYVNIHIYVYIHHTWTVGILYVFDLSTHIHKTKT